MSQATTPLNAPTPGEKTSFTYRSFAQELHHVRIQDDPRATPVDDLVEELRFVRRSDSVEEILPWIDKDNAVLVGEEERLHAIVTAADVTNFLWRRTRTFVLLQDIELATRWLMRSACSGDELAECLTVALQREADKNAQRRLENDNAQRRLEDLTLGDLLSVLGHKASYGRYFKGTFGGSQQMTQSTLEPVREIRNKVFHFRGEASDEEYDALVRARTLLERWVKKRKDA